MFILIALLAIGQPPAADVEKPGTATLRGHVLAADTGRPIRKAQVRIFAAEIRENRVATTDDGGRYEFKEVKAGRYTINATKGSYISLSYGQTRPLESGTPLEIKDGQTVERVDFSLPRGAVITGRIFDEFGEPLSDVMVAPMRYQFVQGKRTLVGAGRQSTTDDNGEFRLFGITPGQYYLQATWRSNMGFGPGAENQPAYAPMFFPGVLEASEAQRFTIGVSQQLSDLVMTLKPTKAVRVSGTVLTSDGRPATGMLNVMRVVGMGFTSNMGAMIKPDGSFQLNGLAPGEYQLRTFPNGPSGPDSETAMAKISVAGDDITDLQLVASKPLSVFGRVIVDPATAQSLPASLFVTAFPMDGPTFGGLTPGRVADDYTFELKTPPGRARISLSNPPAGWSIRAVRLDGADVIDSGIEFKPNRNVRGLEVELTNKVSVVTGLVTTGRSEASRDYTAIAFPQDSDRWKDTNSRYIRTGRPDQDGRFKISGLPSGEYLLIAVDHINPGESSDPDFLERIRTKATRFSLIEGETKSIDLKLNSSS
jgi:protocatechuate 3,4-dioxygenase beta subunit